MEKKLGVSRFVILSGIAVICFFVPIMGSDCLIVFLCNFLKELLNPIRIVLVIGFILWGIISSYQKKSKQNIVLSLLSAVVASISFFDRSIAKEAVDLAFSICITVFVSGTLTVLITESGLVEFVATIFEKFMKKFLDVPGNATMDIITSFFASSSVGVFITNKYYNEKIYTQREACLIASNFSVVSFGFMFGIISIVQLNNVSNYVIIAVIILNFLLGKIMGKIYPICRKPNTFIDGSIRQIVTDAENENRVKVGIRRGAEKAQDFSLICIYDTAKRTLRFCQEILIQVIPIYFMSLVIMRYTDIFEYAGKPFEIILKLLQVPEAELIAPGAIIGILEVSLPAVYISEMTLSLAARFFIGVLSLVQIIFFTETANAILQSDISLNVLELVEIFLLRTVITIPILAVIVNFLF